MTEIRYRVWIEKTQRGWVEINASNEQVAMDRAQQKAEQDDWYPERSYTTPCKAEPITSVAHVSQR